jgi:snoRNA binding domain, fibrillarin
VGRAVLLRCGGELRWVDAAGGVGPALPLGRTPAEAARATLRLSEGFPAGFGDAVRSARPEGSFALGDPALARAVGGLGPGELLPLGERRVARERAWAAADSMQRPFYLALAVERIGHTLSQPEETLISLAREEERIERVLGRESNAASQFLTPGSGPLEEYRRRWDPMQRGLAEHHRALQELLAAAARTAAPNLSATVGPRAAGRLVARAGSVAELARMSSSRLQLLGARRRPGPGRTPRFGVLFRGARMDEVPPGRQGAYARSLAALAAVAARIDAARGRDRSAELVARRDRRVAALRLRA